MGQRIIPDSDDSDADAVPCRQASPTNASVVYADDLIPYDGLETENPGGLLDSSTREKSSYDPDPGTISINQVDPTPDLPSARLPSSIPIVTPSRKRKRQLNSSQAVKDSQATQKSSERSSASGSGSVPSRSTQVAGQSRMSVVIETDSSKQPSQVVPSMIQATSGETSTVGIDTGNHNIIDISDDDLIAMPSSPKKIDKDTTNVVILKLRVDKESSTRRELDPSTDKLKQAKKRGRPRKNVGNPGGDQSVVKRTKKGRGTKKGQDADDSVDPLDNASGQPTLTPSEAGNGTQAHDTQRSMPGDDEERDGKEDKRADLNLTVSQSTLQTQETSNTRPDVSVDEPQDSAAVLASPPQPLPLPLPTSNPSQVVNHAKSKDVSRNLATGPRHRVGLSRRQRVEPLHATFVRK